MSQGADGAVHEVLPPSAHVCSRVHENGGMPYLLLGEQLVWSRFEDQRLCLQPLAAGSEVVETVPSPPADASPLPLRRCFS